ARAGPVVPVERHGAPAPTRVRRCRRAAGGALIPMRIAIDTRALAGRATGVGRYLAEILASRTSLPAAAAHPVVLCSPVPLDVERLRGLDVRIAVAGGRGTSWEQLKLLRLVRKARADVLFAPGYSAPVLAPVPTVLTVHDVSFA